MKVRTAVALFLCMLLALWMSHVFVILFLFGTYPIWESSRIIAGGEFVLSLAIAGLALERLLRLKERR